MTFELTQRPFVTSQGNAVDPRTVNETERVGGERDVCPLLCLDGVEMLKHAEQSRLSCVSRTKFGTYDIVLF